MSSGYFILFFVISCFLPPVTEQIVNEPWQLLLLIGEISCALRVASGSLSLASLFLACGQKQ